MDNQDFKENKKNRNFITNIYKYEPFDKYCQKTILQTMKITNQQRALSHGIIDSSFQMLIPTSSESQSFLKTIMCRRKIS